MNWIALLLPGNLSPMSHTNDSDLLSGLRLYAKHGIWVCNYFLHLLSLNYLREQTTHLGLPNMVVFNAVKH